MPVHLPVLPSGRPLSPSGKPKAKAKRPSRTPKRRFWGEKYLKFRCTRCGNCCADTIVPITHDDLGRLVKATGLRAEQVATFYEGDDFDDGGEGLPFVTLNVGERILGLRKRYYAPDKRETCKFYKNDGCSVYMARPVTCRVWPFTLTVNDRGKITRMAINDAVECPYELDGQVNTEETVHDWEWDDRQDLRWRRKVERWNRQHAGGTRKEFFAFLGFE